MVLQIRLLGAPQIVDAAGEFQTVRGHQAWALLARVLMTPRPLARREIAAELFPETDDPLGALRWCLAALRRALGSSQAMRGDPIEPGLPESTFVDVLRLNEGDLDQEHMGDLLSGIEPRCSYEFSTWLLVERERIGALIDMELRRKAMRAIATGDFDGAIGASRIAVARDAFDEGAHVMLIKSFVMAGRHDAALSHVVETEQMFADELGEKPSSALRSAARRNVALAPGGVSLAATVNTLLDSGLAALSAGAVDTGVDCLRQAAQNAETTGDRKVQATVLFELGTALIHSVRGHDDEGAIFVRQAIELGRECGCLPVVANGLRELGYVDALAGRRPSALEILAEAEGIAGDDETLAGIHGVAGFNLVDWGRIDDGIERYERSLEHARRAGNRRREIWSLGLGAWGHLAAGNLDRADEWLDSCLKLVETTRWISFRPWPLALRAETRLRRQSDPAAVRIDLESAFALSCQLGDPCWEAAVARAMALSHAAEDNPELALQWLEEASLRCNRETDPFAALAVEILSDQYDLCARLGHREKAERCRQQMLAAAARAHMNRHLLRMLQ